MQISINGTYIDGFISATITARFRTACRAFTIVTSNLALRSYPIKKGDQCQIIVEGQTVLDGYVFEIEGSYSADNDHIIIHGRDKTADIIDSTIDYTIFSEWKGGASLKDVCEIVIKKLGLENSIKVIINSDTITAADTKFPIDQYLAGQTGETCFSFIERYAQKLQILITTDGLGNLVLTRGDDQKIINATLINKINDPFNENNVLQCRWRTSDTKRFNKYICWSQLAQAPLDFRFFEGGGSESSKVAANLYGSSGESFDTGIRTSRQFAFTAQLPLSIQEASNRALYQANINRAMSSIYDVTVQKHTYDDVNLWAVNNVVQVYDERADINTQLLVAELTFVQSLDEGNVTKLSLLPRNAFQLQIEQEYYQTLFADSQANYAIIKDFGKRQ